MQRVLHGVVRSTAAVAPAALSALVRTRLHGALREPVNGEAGTGDARSAAATSTARSAGAGRTRWPPRRCCRTLPRTCRPAAAGSAASRRPSEARNERSEWRREGYPPEGPRPRSGLGRVARSRSDAPRLIVAFGTPLIIFGTVIGITTGTGVRISVGIVGGDGSTVSSCRALRGTRTRCTR